MAEMRLPPDLARQVAEMQRRIERLERRATPRLHYVGAPGEIGFLNGWTNYDGAPGVGRAVAFYREGATVHLEGVIRGVTANTAAFRLPEGFKPAMKTASSFSQACGTQVGPAMLTVNYAGDVSCPNATWTWLYGISFRAA